jgi:hypothetical protein
MRWRPRPRSAAPGPDDDVFILDVTERWSDDQHSFWAFTDPDWYAWAVGGRTDPPAVLVRDNDRFGEHLPEDATRNDRVLYLYHGGVMLHGGHYIGAETAELDAWLADREPLGVLTAVEEADPSDPAGPSR